VLEPAAVSSQDLELRLSLGSATDVGGREENEDALFAGDLVPAGGGALGTEAVRLVAVADGMGGYQRGEVASAIAIETLRNVLAETDTSDAAAALKQAFRRANQAIFADSAANGAPEEMGTTLVAGLLRGKYATIANVGDSRAYLVRADRLTQITKDHSLVEEEVAQGALTPEQAQRSPHRNILTHALGNKERLEGKLPNIFELTLLPEDRLLLCSDGFHGVVPEADMVGVLLTTEAADAAKRLVNLAVERGTTDNVSAVVVEAQPTRVSVISRPEVTMVGGGRNSYLVPALVTLGAVLFVVLIILALTLL